MNRAPLSFFLIVTLLFLSQVYSTIKYKSQVSGLESKVDSLQKQVDSLHSENYPCQIELSRYQNAYEIFVKRNPKAASEYGDIISNETE